MHLTVSENTNPLLPFSLPFPANFDSTRAVDGLLDKWASRFPHPKLDSISVWDDIVTSRYAITITV